ncbi:MAG TPA: hypothetical protein VKZ81_26650 [Pseudonocardia sp.]|uniref:hypothetical protein n=1 Tax=Pseudonocardia sp. TaxID=60912 RepID=UPI002B4AB7C4|nr:hypothetical protein [Pseudonocardia sp.]HLU59057.1 hypothetical protein [Pseudonocardia sp.]
MTGPGGCGGHEGIGEELRVLALAALDRVDPVLARLRAGPVTDAPEACASCPVCAIIAALRGERPELAVRLAEHAAGLVAVLRTALLEGAEGGTASGAEPDPAADRPPPRRVQRIPVERRTS